MPFFNRQGEVTSRDSAERDRAYARRHCAGCALLVTAAIGLFLGGCGVWAAGPRGTPEKPELYYWYLNTAGPGPELGVMDARVIALAEALGDSRIEECRELARALAAEEEGPEVRQQAVGYLIETYLAEGDFAGAREAAREWPEALSRVERLEREYRRKVGELQRLVVNARDAEHGARAQFETARVHEAFRRVDLAEESYWKVVRRYPGAAEAGKAIGRIAELRWSRGDQAGAISACESVVESARDSALGVEACRALFETFLRHEKSGHEAMRQRLYGIAQAYADTLVACAAGLGVGSLYAAEGMPEIAEARWQEVLGRTRDPRLRAAADQALAATRYALARRADMEGDHEAAVRWMSLAVSDPDCPERAAGLRSLAFWHCLREEYEIARGRYLEAAAAASDRDTALLARADAAGCLVPLGMVKEAIAEYEAILGEPGVSASVAEHCQTKLAWARKLLTRQPSGGEKHSLDRR